MKTTPFTEKHIALGAKMHEFAGYNMPIEYSGIIDEHITVCQGVGVFDVSHMGEFWVKGPQALAFLQKITSNNVAALAPGKIQYTCFPNEDGGIVDDLLVYQYEPEKYMLVVNASNMEKDWNWCVSHNTEGAELENSSDNIAQLAIQGPKAISVLQKLTDIDLATIPYYTFKVGTFASEENVIISNQLNPHIKRKRRVSCRQLYTFTRIALYNLQSQLSNRGNTKTQRVRIKTQILHLIFWQTVFDCFQIT